jgi:hypothetical protein
MIRSCLVGRMNIRQLYNFNPPTSRIEYAWRVGAAQSIDRSSGVVAGLVGCCRNALDRPQT